MDYEALKDELENDPEDLGYAPLVSSGAHLDLANLLNEPGAGPVSVEVMSKNDFLLAITPVLLRLPGKTAAVQAKWDRILALARAAESFHVNDPRVVNLLDLAVSDGILEQGEVNAMKTKTGSRAEVLFGIGSVVSHSDIANAFLS